jgi:hypothetical protein
MADQVFSAFAACSVETLDEKSIHSCRVHLKRARALARMGRDAAPGLCGVINESARDIMHLLSEARDLSALAKAARELGETSGAKARRALQTCASALDQEREALTPPQAGDVRAALRGLLSLAQVWPETTEKHIKLGAERIAWRAREAYRDGAEAKRAELRHAWRKREKDRLYAVDLLDDEWPQNFPKRRASSRALSDCLGREREILLLSDRLKSDPHLAGGLEDARYALSVCAQQKRQSRKKARKLGAKLHRGGA